MRTRIQEFYENKTLFRELLEVHATTLQRNINKIKIVGKICKLDAKFRKIMASDKTSLIQTKSVTPYVFKEIWKTLPWQYTAETWNMFDVLLDSSNGKNCLSGVMYILCWCDYYGLFPSKVFAICSDHHICLALPRGGNFITLETTNNLAPCTNIKKGYIINTRQELINMYTARVVVHCHNLVFPHQNKPKQIKATAVALRILDTIKDTKDPTTLWTISRHISDDTEYLEKLHTLLKTIRGHKIEFDCTHIILEIVRQVAHHIKYCRKINPAMIDLLTATIRHLNSFLINNNSNYTCNIANIREINSLFPII